MTESNEWLERYITEQMRRHQNAIDEMCERMLLQDGTDYGVHVQNNPDGTVTVTLSPEVPFGEIHYQLITPFEWPTLAYGEEQ